MTVFCSYLSMTLSPTFTYIVLFFNRMKTLVAMETYSLYLLVTGKVESAIYCYVIADTLYKRFTQFSGVVLY